MLEKALVETLSSIPVGVAMIMMANGFLKYMKDTAEKQTFILSELVAVNHELRGIVNTKCKHNDKHHE